MLVFDEIGGTSAFADWARRHPTEFYAARLESGAFGGYPGQMTVVTAWQ